MQHIMYLLRIYLQENGSLRNFTIESDRHLITFKDICHICNVKCVLRFAVLAGLATSAGRLESRVWEL